jgi:hypothetical protein
MTQAEIEKEIERKLRELWSKVMRVAITASGCVKGNIPFPLWVDYRSATMGDLKFSWPPCNRFDSGHPVHWNSITSNLIAWLASEGVAVVNAGCGWMTRKVIGFNETEGDVYTHSRDLHSYLEQIIDHCNHAIDAGWIGDEG